MGSAAEAGRDPGNRPSGAVSLLSNSCPYVQREKHSHLVNDPPLYRYPSPCSHKPIGEGSQGHGGLTRAAAAGTCRPGVEEPQPTLPCPVPEWVLVLLLLLPGPWSPQERPPAQLCECAGAGALPFAKGMSLLSSY